MLWRIGIGAHWATHVLRQYRVYSVPPHLLEAGARLLLRLQLGRQRVQPLSRSAVLRLPLAMCVRQVGGQSTAAPGQNCAVRGATVSTETTHPIMIEGVFLSMCAVRLALLHSHSLRRTV